MRIRIKKHADVKDNGKALDCSKGIFVHSPFDDYFERTKNVWIEQEDAQWDSVDRQMRDVEDTYEYGIKSVVFSHRCTIVNWEDGDKTIVKDETISRDDSISFDVTGKTMIVTDKNGNKKKEIDYKKWKEDGLTSAIAKHRDPDYFNILEKWCD